MKTPIEILIQGNVYVNEAVIVAKSENLVAIEIDFKTKRFELIEDNELIFAPEIWDGSLTRIKLSEFVNWKVFCSETTRYTCQLCLIKN